MCVEVRLHREGVAEALGCSGRIEVIGTASRPAEALALVAELAPEIPPSDIPTREDELDVRLWIPQDLAPFMTGQFGTALPLEW